MCRAPALRRKRRESLMGMPPPSRKGSSTSGGSSSFDFTFLFEVEVPLPMGDSHCHHLEAFGGQDDEADVISVLSQSDVSTEEEKDDYDRATTTTKRRGEPSSRRRIELTFASSSLPRRKSHDFHYSEDSKMDDAPRGGDRWSPYHSEPPLPAVSSPTLSSAGRKGDARPRYPTRSIWEEAISATSTTTTSLSSSPPSSTDSPPRRPLRTFE